MLTQTEQWQKPGHVGNPWKQPVQHEHIAYVSWFAEPTAPNEYVEAAFFTHEDEWYLDDVTLLRDYAEPAAGDTRVYRFVPRNSLLAWLSMHRL
jgi:hypothetical protein